MEYSVKPAELVTDEGFTAYLKARTNRLFMLGEVGLLLQGGIQMVERFSGMTSLAAGSDFISGLGSALAIICLLNGLRNRRIMENPELVRKQRLKFFSK